MNIRSGKILRIQLVLGFFSVMICHSAYGDSTIPVSHATPVEPHFTTEIRAELAQIGLVTSLRVSGDTLYVGGTTGLAALDHSGKVLWTLELPAAMARQIDADGQHVAFTSFDLAGIDRSALLGSKFLAGDLLAKPKYINAVVGLVTLDGKLVWSVSSSEQTRLSPPALGRTGVGVTRTKSFGLFDLATGRESANISMETSMLGEGLDLQSATTRPLVWNDNFFVAHLHTLVKVGPGGEELATSHRFGLTLPFHCITGGPTLFGKKVYFGNISPERDKDPLLLAVDEKGGNAGKEDLDAGSKTRSPATCLVVNGNRLYVASNFTVFAYDESGEKLWKAGNKGGGLYPGSHRGVKFIGNSFEKVFPVPKSLLANTQMVATARYLYITSSHKKDLHGVERAETTDALTVLDAKTGKYVNSIFLDVLILDMVLYDSQLALATTDGIKFLPLQ